MVKTFSHLQIQSEFSIENSIIRIKNLVISAKNLGFSSLALTDTNNVFAAIKFYRAAIAEKIKPIFGATITMEDRSSTIILCMNTEGYINLSRLISLSYKKENRVFVTWEELFSHHQHLILISDKKSQLAAFISKNALSKAQDLLTKINNTFASRHYLGISRIGVIGEEKYLHNCVRLSLLTNTPLVALGDVQFIKEDDYEIHEARICIASGGLVDDDNRPRLYTKEQYLKSPSQLIDLFDDIPEAITNSIEISKRCNVHFALDDKSYLPQFPIPERFTTSEFFTNKSQVGLANIIAKHNLKHQKEEYQQRLEFEIKIIVELNFSGYFLIVADFIRWARENNIPVGPGRGSGAGSLVAYALEITKVDPLKYNLLFERFLNPERVSMPDFDIDFAPYGRDKVIDYVARKYGRDNVSQIITFGTMAAKGVIRDVGRVLGQPYGFSDKLSKLIPNEPKITIDEALNYEQTLVKKAKKDQKKLSKSKAAKEQELRESEELRKRYTSEEAVTSVIDLSRQLEGMARNAGTHAGGVVIAPNNINNFCPTYKGLGDDDVVVCQFDKKDIQAIGLVKFDFLGLSNLSVIQKTIKIIAENNLSTKHIDIDTINLEDEKVYTLYQQGDTTGIFQMESRGMREYLERLKPTSINDIVAMNALYRPGAMEYVDNYIEVKHGKKIEYAHPILEEVLAPTNGVFVYQEQVMFAAQKMAGFTLGDADILRKAITDKNIEEMEKRRHKFIDGALKVSGVGADKANEIFDYINKFAGYGFNKSHSVAYALVSYQTAWLKTHFRPAFMSAVISGVMGDTDRVKTMVEEIKSSRIKILSPCINLSNYDFSLDINQNIIYGLGAIKGVGEAFIEQIIKHRKDGYIDLFDFCYRIEKKYLNKRAIEALIHSGSFDTFKQNRATLLINYETAIKNAEIKQQEKINGQGSLFGDDFVKTGAKHNIKYQQKEQQTFRQKLELEKIVLGFYFSAYPTDEYTTDLEMLKAKFPHTITLRGAKNVRIVAMIEYVFYKKTKKGQMATLILNDGVKKINVILFDKALKTYGEKIVIDTIVVASCTVMENYSKDKKYKDIFRLRVNTLEEIEAEKNKYAKYLGLYLQEKHARNFEQIKSILLQNKGSCPTVLFHKVESIIGSQQLSDKYNIKLTKDLLIQLNNVTQENIAKITY